jgi:dTMP kinase
MRGSFITFEGIEGCGKSTQARRLHAALVAASRPALLTREPGGTVVADAVRAVLLDPAHAGMAPETELLLFAAARADHVRRVVEPALQAGTHVVCDRFHDSTHAYQGAGRGLDAALIQRIDAAARGDLLPDVTVLLDLPADLGLGRARGRNAGGADGGAEGRLDDEDLAFHRRVRSGFLRRAGDEPRRIWVVDAHGGEEDVASRVVALVRRVLPGLLP